MPQIRTDLRGISLLSISHTLTDINQGAIPALLPFLVVQRGMTYLQASGVVMAATLISSILQPILGHSSDRKPMPWLMPLGLFGAGLGVALVGLTTSYWAMIACILMTGIGVATFHPEGYRFANYVSGENKGSGMSYFAVGGNAGFAIGPVIITSLILAFGIKGTVFMALGTTIMAIILFRELPRLTSFHPALDLNLEAGKILESKWGAFIRLSAVIALRSSLYYGLSSFVPLYLIKTRGATIPQANGVLTLMAVMAATGTLLGGFLGDKAGRKRILVVSIALLPVTLTGFIYLTGVISTILLGMTSLFIACSTTVGIVMGQEYIPNNIGVASGVTTGLAIGLGGISAPIYGGIADHYGIPVIFDIMIILPVFATILAFTLPVLAIKISRIPENI
jgi:FSR family fosmidomycin resistance protein-like MFS transporter